MAILVVTVILLCSTVSVLTLLNIRLFRENVQPETPDTSPLSIYAPDNKETEPSMDAVTLSTEPVPTERAGVDIEISSSPMSVANIPQEGGLSLQEIYEKTIGSVVSISCTLYGGSSTGTGVILTGDGYIVTNAHVVEDAVSIQVILDSDEILDAALVGADEISDLAVLWVDHDGLVPAELGDSDSLRVGDAVVAIGDPLGVSLRGTMTNGIVSGINRDIQVDGRTMTLIQTNAALNEGNSGGPLINCYGQVVGINTMKIGDTMSSAGVEGLGFAIPSTTVREIVTQLIGQGYVSGRPDLGIEGETVSVMKQIYGRLPSGLYITDIDQDCDAYAKGIREDDVVMAVNGVRISGADDFQTQLYACEVGQEVILVLYRNGRQYEVTVTVGEYGA